MSTAVLVIGLVSLVAGAALASRGPAFRLRRLAEARRDQGGRAPEGPEGRALIEAEAGCRPAGGEGVPLVLELLGAMLQAGLALPRALDIAARTGGSASEDLARAAAALELGADWSHAWPNEPGPDTKHLRAALQFAATTGAPSAELLFAQARQVRRTRHRELEKRAAALGVRLVVPLGVCSLPAFLCLGVVPVLLAMMPAG